MIIKWRPSHGYNGNTITWNSDAIVNIQHYSRSVTIRTIDGEDWSYHYDNDTIAIEDYNRLINLWDLAIKGTPFNMATKIVETTRI